MDFNQLIEHFASTLFRVRGVYKYAIPAKSQGRQNAAPYPGFIFPLSGSAEYQFNNTPYLVTTDTVVHGLANSSLRKRVVGEQSWEYVSVLYEPFHEGASLKLKNLHFSLSLKQTPQLVDMLHQLYAASSRPGGLPAFQVETLFHRILEETFIGARSQAPQGAKELFAFVSDYIHAHYSDPLSVKLLAQQHGVNENRLFYVFQKFAGMGPGDYLRMYRLNRGRDLLMTSSLPIGAIAMQVGYPDAFYFSRSFKNYFGVSPRQFRGSSRK
ncbi:Transcriptional regulator, AraC family [Clostridiaceae bacterium JG1575]|nr:Transcriptional regulator, AraC family [Clostridiaceae bacterium JG1575]